MTTDSSHFCNQEGLARTWPNSGVPNMASKHPSRNVSFHGRENRLRGRLHEGWEAIYVGTALCDFCSKQGRGVVQKCIKCGLSICYQCSLCGALQANKNHILDHDAVSWDRTAVEPRRNRKITGIKMMKRARHVRGASVSEKLQVITSVDGQQQREEEQAEGVVAEASDGKYPRLSLERERSRRQRHCEKETQTPAWWMAEDYTRIFSFPVSTTDNGHFLCTDVQDAANILAKMPLALAGGVVQERTILDSASQGGGAAMNDSLSDTMVFHHHGKQEALYNQGLRNTETEYKCDDMGHQTRSDAGEQTVEETHGKMFT
ncbi:hypothetical protein E4U21_001898 [Claviceps maximensis]|nr:hypothetical protein E4U21_001898 [Claviceps maximensis]